MKRSSGISVQACALFSVLMVAAGVTTCVFLSLAVYTGVGVLSLLTDGSAYEGPVSDDRPQTRPDTGRTAPDFALTDLNGNQVSLTHFSGRPVVVNFWATWCPPCRAEVPHLVQAYERERGEVIFLAVSVEESARTVRRFADKNGMFFTILLDEDGNVASDYRVRGIPVTFFISRDGEIAARYEGGLSPHRLEDGLSRIR
jgi:thiol-disulfide isomerase/thioredoxin